MAQLMLNASTLLEPFEFEKIVDNNNRLRWMQNCWHHSIYWSILYVTVIFSLQRFMKNRPALELKTPLIVWNTLLALFSIGGTLRMTPGLIHIISEFGFTFSVCNSEYGRNIQPTVFWGWLFAVSKVLEFGDTLFIVLRKRKLIFLHWYHHVMTLIMCWYTLGNLVAVTYWFCVMNYFVHSFMYTYYTLSALDIKIPRNIAMSITSMQLLQMIAGSFVCYWAIHTKLQGHACEFPDNAVKVALSVYLTYVLLFSRLFYNSYIAKSSKKLKKK
ncbi:very long chain fatty acid elongase 6-like [Centruroides vittatus]|uniref:very long chain fatty acid elongase 6-like n=1 Tax=Centruroides vittatus TaxID=120091 RepID=UPI00351035E1